MRNKNAACSGDDFSIREMLSSPRNFLFSSPSACGTASQKNWIQMSDGLVEMHRIGDQREIAVEVFLRSESMPEFLGTQIGLCFSRILSKDLVGCCIEVGKNAVTV